MKVKPEVLCVRCGEVGPHGGRRLCDTCYDRLYKVGGLDQYPKVGAGLATLGRIEDFAELRQRGLSVSAAAARSGRYRPLRPTLRAAAGDLPPGGERMTRRFQLERLNDVSGVSGVGIVADGVQWPDGKVTVRWRGPRPSTVCWDGMADVVAVHGHQGATRVLWLDDNAEPTEHLF